MPTRHESEKSRRYPIGAELISPDRTHFRVWAPEAERVVVVIENSASPTAYELESESAGYFSGEAPVGAGALYRFRLNDTAKLYPDLASRSQPHGPHGLSQVVDPTTFRWTDQGWRGAELKGQVIYEMHVGTFTREGTWRAAARELRELADFGVTLIEMMPVNAFPGKFGWGYDGVDLFAPTQLYGRPDDFRHFINEAHAVGIGVILDVVYNHVGADGNYFKCFAKDYFTDRYECEWGEPFNLDGPNSGPVREFFLTNACYWIEEFHLDGFRIDATQAIYDQSPEYLLCAMTRAARKAAKERSIIFIGENEPQHTKLIRSCDQGGDGLDALWNDDFHHTALVALTGRSEAYYMDYQGTPQEFISAVKYGFLYQGQWYKWQKKRRGTPAFDIEPAAFVAFIENHDQVANSGFGKRSYEDTSPGRFRAMAALLLLGPWTPMFFQGQEFCASTRFFYFNDLNESMHEAVRKGRTEFLSQFPSIASDETREQLAVPSDPETFERSKVNFSDREKHACVYAMHRDLLKLRREDALFRAQRKGGVDGAVLNATSFVLRYFGEGGSGEDRLLIVNFGRAAHLNPAPEPLLAPPLAKRWETLWSSESARYGGPGQVALDTAEDNWLIPAEAAVVLHPVNG
jgi:maltooligosyltrehalose trehalohydrolase